MEEFIAMQIMVAQAQRLYPKLDPFDPNCQHIAFLNSHVKSFSKQFKNTDMRHFKFHWEFIYGKIFSNKYFPVISRIGPQYGRSGCSCNTTVRMIMQPTQQLTVPLHLTYI
jgi:hypothetical protein